MSGWLLCGMYSYNCGILSGSLRKGSPIGVAVHNVTTGNSFNKQELPLCAETSRIGSHWECGWTQSGVEAAHSFLVNWKSYVLCLHRHYQCQFISHESSSYEM